MRKITNQAIKAFIRGKNFKLSNTEVLHFAEMAYMRLHGNLIATARVIDGRIFDLQISNKGWHTNTTKERLNAFPGVSIAQRNFNWYLNGKEWNGILVVINSDETWEYI